LFSPAADAVTRRGSRSRCSCEAQEPLSSADIWQPTSWLRDSYGISEVEFHCSRRRLAIRIKPPSLDETLKPSSTIISTVAATDSGHQHSPANRHHGRPQPPRRRRKGDCGQISRASGPARTHHIIHIRGDRSHGVLDGGRDHNSADDAHPGHPVRDDSIQRPERRNAKQGRLQHVAAVVLRGSRLWRGFHQSLVSRPVCDHSLICPWCGTSAGTRRETSDCRADRASAKPPSAVSNFPVRFASVSNRAPGSSSASSTVSATTPAIASCGWKRPATPLRLKTCLGPIAGGGRRS
jgi:hypothetical protein